MQQPKRFGLRAVERAAGLQPIRLRALGARGDAMPRHMVLRIAAILGLILGLGILAQKALAGSSEGNIRGVVTNLRFLDQLITHPQFAQGDYTTKFIDTTPELFRWPRKRDRATRILRYIGETIVNGNEETKSRKRDKDPDYARVNKCDYDKAKRARYPNEALNHSSEAQEASGEHRDDDGETDEHTEICERTNKVSCW